MSAIGDQWTGNRSLPRDAVAQLVDVAGPLLQVAALDAPGQVLPRRPVTQGRDGHHVVGGTAAMGVVAEPQQPGVGPLGQRRHPFVTERRFELLLGRPLDLMSLVQEEHGRSLYGVPGPGALTGAPAHGDVSLGFGTFGPSRPHGNGHAVIAGGFRIGAVSSPREGCLWGHLHGAGVAARRDCWLLGPCARRPPGTTLSAGRVRSSMV